jgi:ribosome modulation factor
MKMSTYEKGYTAGRELEQCDPPENLTEEEKHQWVNGWCAGNHSNYDD